MVVLHKIMLSVPKAHGKHLLSGGSVKLKLVKGKHALFLTKPQLSKLQKAVDSGKTGVIIKLTKAQITHQVMNGGSFWSSIWSGIKKVASDVYDEAVKPNIGKVANAVVDAGIRKVAGSGVKKRKSKAKANAKGKGKAKAKGKGKGKAKAKKGLSRF